MSVSILIGDVFDRLRDMPANSVDCVVTSPPYWGLRDYGVAGQIGLEPTLGEHLDVMVRVFREVRRVLKAHGTVWLNYGDCYAATPNGRPAAEVVGDDRSFRDKPFSTVGPVYVPAFEKTSRVGSGGNKGSIAAAHGGRVVAGGYLKPKDLCMIPNRLAIALQDDGWWVRSEIIWHKPNPMPESVYDRPTTAHEKIWLLTKREDYFYDHAAIREPVTGSSKRRLSQDVLAQRGSLRANGGTRPDRPMKAVARKAGPNSRVNVDRVPVSKKARSPKDEARDDQGLRPSDRMGRGPGWRGKTVEPGLGIRNNDSFMAATGDLVEDRNARNVWTISPKAFRGAHFATFPPALAERCIKAGTPRTVCSACGSAASCGGLCEIYGREPGHVLDPFGGAGTVGLVAKQLGLRATLIELNPEYADIAARRLLGEAAASSPAACPEGVAA